MSDSKPTAAEVNSGQILSFPCQRTIIITLTLNVEDQAKYDYLLTPVGSELQIGFVADLFDLFNFGTELQVSSINNISFEELRKRMGFSS